MGSFKYWLGIVSTKMPSSDKILVDKVTAYVHTGTSFFALELSYDAIVVGIYSQISCKL